MGYNSKQTRDDAQFTRFKAGPFQCCCRPEDDSTCAPRTTAAQDAYDCGDADNTVQFNTEEEEKETEELTVST